MLVYAALNKREVTRMQLLCAPLGLAVSIGVMTSYALWFLLIFVLVDLASSFVYTKIYQAIEVRMGATPGWKFYCSVVAVQLLLIAMLLVHAWG